MVILNDNVLNQNIKMDYVNIIMKEWYQKWFVIKIV
jgi:hypothetical protein